MFVEQLFNVIHVFMFYNFWPTADLMKSQKLIV